MPKLKTKKAASKRYRVTKNKKVLRTKAGHRHIMTGHSRKKKRQQRKGVQVDVTDRHRVLDSLPYHR